VFMEGVLLKTITNKWKEEVNCTARLREELKIRDARIAYFNELIECGDDTLRAKWSVDLPALPEWVIARQKRTTAKKRPREDNNQEQVHKKVKFSDSTPQDVETLEQGSQSEEEGEVVICTEDGEVEEVLEPEDRSHKRLRTIQEELDEVVPMKTRSVQFLRKKGKKKKRAATPVFFDYAEAIESEKRMFSDEDYALETEFEETF